MHPIEKIHGNSNIELNIIGSSTPCIIKMLKYKYLDLPEYESFPYHFFMLKILNPENFEYLTPKIFNYYLYRKFKTYVGIFSINGTIMIEYLD